MAPTPKSGDVLAHPDGRSYLVIEAAREGESDFRVVHLNEPQTMSQDWLDREKLFKVDLVSALNVAQKLLRDQRETVKATIVRDLPVKADAECEDMLAKAVVKLGPALDKLCPSHGAVLGFMADVFGVQPLALYGMGEGSPSELAVAWAKKNGQLLPLAVAVAKGLTEAAHALLVPLHVNYPKDDSLRHVTADVPLGTSLFPPKEAADSAYELATDEAKKIAATHDKKKIAFDGVVPEGTMTREDVIDMARLLITMSKTHQMLCQWMLAHAVPLRSMGLMEIDDYPAAPSLLKVVVKAIVWADKNKKLDKLIASAPWRFQTGQTEHGVKAFFHCLQSKYFPGTLIPSFAPQPRPDRDLLSETTREHVISHMVKHTMGTIERRDSLFAKMGVTPQILREGGYLVSSFTFDSTAFAEALFAWAECEGRDRELVFNLWNDSKEDIKLRGAYRMYPVSILTDDERANLETAFDRIFREGSKARKSGLGYLAFIGTFAAAMGWGSFVNYGFDPITGLILKAHREGKIPHLLFALNGLDNSIVVANLVAKYPVPEPEEAPKPWANWNASLREEIAYRVTCVWGQRTEFQKFVEANTSIRFASIDIPPSPESYMGYVEAMLRWAGMNGKERELGETLARFDSGKYAFKRAAMSGLPPAGLIEAYKTLFPTLDGFERHVAKGLNGMPSVAGESWEGYVSRVISTMAAARSDTLQNMTLRAIRTCSDDPNIAALLVVATREGWYTPTKHIS